MRTPDQDMPVHQDHGTRRAAKIFYSCIALFLAGALSGCGGNGKKDADSFFKDPNGNPIKTAIKTNIPLAYAASAAMAAATGNAPANTSTSTVCSSYPCIAVVTVTDDDSAMPLQLGDFGTTTVYGYWSSADEAIISVSFGHDAGSGLFPVHTVAMVPVRRIGGMLELAYARLDVNVGVKDPETLTETDINLAWIKIDVTPSGDATQNIAMDGWRVQVQDANTAAISDDTYTLAGGGQYIDSRTGAITFYQIGLVDVLLEPGCALNPASGSVVLQEVRGSTAKQQAGQAFFTFHPACDGTAEVLAGTGVYLLATGRSIPLHLETP